MDARMPANLREAAEECKQIVEESIQRNIGDSLLLSGGLDTGIIAHVAAQHSEPKCYTVAFSSGRPLDLYYAKTITKKLNLEWELVELSTEQLQERLAEVVKVLKTFDPMEVRNSVAVYHGLKAAKSGGFSKVMTGDAADELFAGYSFTFSLGPKAMIRKLKGLWRIMHFSSQPMAASLGLAASLPYLDPSVVRFARILRPTHFVGSRYGKKYGKLILRLAFEETIGKRNAWRVKTPIEYGSGTTSLQNYYSTRIGDDEFNRNRQQIEPQDGVKIRDKEQFAYYRLYRGMFPPPRETARTKNICPDCGADVRPQATFCITCGAYPIKAFRPRTNLRAKG